MWQKNNAEFWKAKILQNIERDKRDFERLENAGWKVIVVWECQLKKARSFESLEGLKRKILH